MRLDQALAARYDLSRRKARELIAAGRVLVNQRSVRIASREIADGAEIAVAEDTPAVNVIATADGWIAINKPAGMPSQPPRDRQTLSAEALARLPFRQ